MELIGSRNNGSSSSWKYLVIWKDLGLNLVYVIIVTI